VEQKQKNPKIQKSKNTCPRSGGNLEVMGLLLGKVDANVMVVMDSFALPVEGTETRVNAQAQGYEYMTAYIEAAKQVGFELQQQTQGRTGFVPTEKIKSPGTKFLFSKLFQR
jgi:hypothetical protein